MIGEHVAARFGFVEQLCAKIWMCNLDQCCRAFADGFSPKLGDAILSDYVVHVAATGHDASAAFQRADDAALAALCGSGGQGNDRFTAGAAGGAADEINLPADAREEAPTDRVRGDLSREIDG